MAEYRQFFQVHGKSAREDIIKLNSAPLTNWREVTHRQDRYHTIDSIELRRQLGEITSQEVSEVNRVLGGSYIFTRSRSEPAKLSAWNTVEALGFAGAGGALGLFGRFARGHNNLWLFASALPFCSYLLVQSSRQPTTLVDNAYRYLIAKRAATAEYEANQAKILSNEWAQSAEYGALSGALSAQGKTLYDLEAQLVSQIESGSFNKQ